MTNSPNLDHEPEPRKPRWRRTVIGLSLAGAVGAGAIAGVTYLQHFVEQELAPQVAKSLNEMFDRPVKVGAVERISWNGLTFGESELPATERDPDQVKVRSIEVRFDPWDVVWERTLRLTVTLVRPEGYIEQDEKGEWISTTIQQQEDQADFVEIQLDRLEMRDGQLLLVPRERKPETDEPSIDTQAESETEESAKQKDTNQNESTNANANANANELEQVYGELGEAIAFKSVDGWVTLRDENQQIDFEVDGESEKGGAVRLAGEVDRRAERTALQVRGRGVMATQVDALVPLPLDLQAGRGDVDLAIDFPQGQTPLTMNGTIHGRDLTLKVAALPQTISQVNGTLKFTGQRINFENVKGLYGEIGATLGGSLNPQQGYDLTAKVRSTTIKDLLETFDLEFPFPVAGVFQSEVKITGAIDQPRVVGVARSIAPGKFDQIEIANSQTWFTLTQAALTFDRIRAVPTVGGLLTGQGLVQLGDDGRVNFNLRAEDMPGDAVAKIYGAAPAFTVGQVDADVEVAGPLSGIETIAKWQAPQATYPGRGTVTVTGDRVRFEDTAILFADGIIEGQGVAAKGRWDADVQMSGIRLVNFSPELRGLLSGRGRLTGSLDNFSLAAIRGDGEVKFSDGMALITDPMNASVKWLGDRIQVNNATARNFAANGFVYVATPENGTPAITNLDLNVQLQNYAIANLPIPTPEMVQLGGTTDFSGKLTGSLAAVSVAGRLGVNEGAVNQVAFAPRLDGDFRYAMNGETRLSVAGGGDRISLALDSTNRPLSFLVQRGETLAQGTRQSGSDRLIGTVENFALRTLNVAPAVAYGFGAIDGLLNGRFDLNLADLSNPAIMGEVAIATPALGYLKAEKFTGKFRYVNGVAALTDAEIRRGKSRYVIAGSLDPNAATPFQGQITADQGRIEDLLTAFQWFDIADLARGIQPPVYGNAADVQTIPVGNPADRLWRQLQRYSEIVLLRQQERLAQEQATFLPDLEKLEGGFAGTIQLAFSTQDGLTADFNLNGQDWQWDQYPIQQVVAKGKFDKGQFPQLELGFKSDESVMTLTGALGGEQQLATFRASNIPAAAARDILNLPIDVQGKLNANANLTGSVSDPNIIGGIELVEGQLNQATVPSLGFTVGYEDAKVTVFGNKSNPFVFNAEVPYQIPFTADKPASDRFKIRLDVQNEGLTLVSLLTDQVSWKGGEGKVELNVQGTIEDTPQGLKIAPEATGFAEFKNANIGAASLPEDLTNVNGRVLFKNDRIQVEDTIEGTFSDGKVLVKGILPIRAPLGEEDVDRNSPLTLSLDKLVLNLKNLYNGSVNGEMLITGTALAPLITGQVTLSDGRILLPDEQQAAATGNAPVVVSSPPESGVVTPPQLTNLKLVLGDRVLITRDPILNFVAKGELGINGTLDALKPEGTIRLTSGQVNLFTTQFSLARGYNSRATFSANRGLDPFLDIRLTTSVPEVVRLPARTDDSPFGAAEIADTPASRLGEIQTVRVQASVQGLASQLSRNLELTSSPSRTQSEIVALLGGNFVNNLGRDGNPTLAIASVAGSALLTNLQTLVTNTLGLTDFRLFPTTVLSENERSSTLALAGELGLNLTNDLSVSALQLLTVEEPTQFSIRYRVNDEILLRGSSNFEGDSRAAIEFERRF